MKLVTQTVSSMQEKKTPPKTHHVLVIDCSGSMYYDLPKIRLQLHNRLPSLLGEGDLISLVWFSGRGEFGRLVDRVEVKNLMQLEKLNQAIDRWLQPMGCTGFVEPLQSVKDLLGMESDGRAVSLLFLTDGCDNEWGTDQILTATEELQSLVQAASFVEYGFYCNHSLLEKMAETLGGQVVFAEDFDQYDPVFEQVIKLGAPSKKVEVLLQEEPMFGLVWAVGENGPQTFKVDTGKVWVPETVSSIHFFNSDGKLSDDDAAPALQGLSVLALRRQSKFVKEALSEIGDVRLWNLYSNAFGKQNTYDCAQEFLKTSLDHSKLYSEGKSSDLKEDPNAFTVLDLVHVLQKTSCKVDLEALNYSRIGKATKTVDGELTEEEKAALAEEMSKAKSPEDLEKVLEKGKLLAASKTSVKLKWDNKVLTVGDVVWNETRPNLSIRFFVKGTVELPSPRPAGLPDVFHSFTYRNYTVIKDGLLNIEELPVYLSQEGWDELRKHGLVQGDWKDELQTLNLRKLPLINQGMIKQVTPEFFMQSHLSLLNAKALKKVLKARLDELEPAQKSARIAETYGEEAATWLSNLGITDSGFSPRRETVPGTDQYMAVELEVKIKASTIPSVAALNKKLAKGSKINFGDSILLEAIKKVDEMVKDKPDVQKKALLKASLESVNLTISILELNLAEIRFGIVVGQTWFEGTDPESTHLTYKGMEADLILKDTVQFI